MRYFLPIILTIFFCFSCTGPNEEDPVKLNSPKEVAQFWLENYYNNNFEAAKSYSTVLTQEMIDTIQSVIFTDLEEVVDFKIKNLRCQEKEGKADCTYVFVENKTEIPDDISLVHKEGQWLVHAKLLDDELLKEDDIEDLSKDFEDALNQVLEQK